MSGVISSMSGVISSICDVLVMLISFGNLVYLIQTYKSDKKERLQQQEEQREYERERERKQRKYIWYREIVIEHGIREIDRFFVETESLLDGLEPSNTDETVAAFRNHLKEMQQTIPHSVKVINKQLSSQLCRLIEDCEDILFSYIDRFKRGTRGGVSGTKRQLRDKYYVMISALYQQSIDIDTN